MNTHRMVALAVSALVLTVPCLSLKADLLYYMPFDDGTNSTLANSGTAGGTATQVTGISGATAPSVSQVQVAPNLGSTHSEFYPVTGPTEANNRGGAVVLPSSTTALRLDSSTVANQMTLSAWVYWNGNAGGTITSPAGIASTMNSSNNAGWSLRIQSDGKVRFSWVQTAGGGRNRDTVNSVITAGQWSNVTLVFDSINSQPAVIYVNGVSQSTTGSSGDPLMGIMKSDTNDVALGVSYHTAGVGRQSMNGYQDDVAIWNTALTSAKIKALNTAPTELSGYNAGVMNSLFTTYDAQSSTVVGSISWSYATAFDVTGKTVGDTFLGGDGNYYMWLAGTSGSALGLVGVTSVPEPGTAALIMGASVLAFIGCRRRRTSVQGLDRK